MESGGIVIIRRIERSLKDLKTWLPQAQDEVMENIHNKKLREQIDELTNGDYIMIKQAISSSGLFTSIQLIRLLSFFQKLEESKK